MKLHEIRPTVIDHGARMRRLDSYIRTYGEVEGRIIYRTLQFSDQFVLREVIVGMRSVTCRREIVRELKGYKTGVAMRRAS